MKKNTAQKRIFFGWPLTVVLGLLYFMSSGFVLSTATIINPMMLKDPSMELNGTLLGAGFSIFILMQGIPAPFVGQLVAKAGARITMAIGGVIMAAGALSMAYIVRSPMLYIVCFGVLMSIGSIMAGQISVQSTVGQWFIAKRGFAMMIVMTLGGLASICAPLTVNMIVDIAGGTWQAGWYLLCGFGILIIPIALLLVKNKPADIGQFPDGSIDATAFESAKENYRVYKNTDSISYGQALKRPGFWLIALAGTGGFSAYSLTSSQGVIHFTSLGYDQSIVVGAVAFMGFAGIVGKIIVGMLADRIEPIRLIGICLCIIALAIGIASVAANIFIVYSYYICIGFSFGAISTALPTTVANYFGLTAFSKNLGTVMLTTTLISSLIPIVSGVIFDTTGSLAYAFIIVAAVALMCAVCGFLVRFPNKDKGST